MFYIEKDIGMRKVLPQDMAQSLHPWPPALFNEYRNYPFHESRYVPSTILDMKPKWPCLHSPHIMNLDLCHIPHFRITCQKYGTLLFGGNYSECISI